MQNILVELLKTAKVKLKGHNLLPIRDLIVKF